MMYRKEAPAQEITGCCYYFKRTEKMRSCPKLGYLEGVQKLII